MQRVIPLPIPHDELFQGELARRIPYHRMYGKQYCLPSVARYSGAEYEELRSASEQIDRIYRKALRFAQRHLPDAFLTGQLGVHPSLLPAARAEIPHHGISRQDWIVTERGLKCIENNTDTPTGIPETAFLGNEVVGRHTALRSASEGMRPAMKQAFGELIAHYRSAGLTGTIGCACYDWHSEDQCNTEYVLDVIRELGYPAVFVPLDRLEIVKGVGLFGGGERIDILYRLYPLEYLIHDEDPGTGFPVGEALMELALLGKVGLINPAQSVITQSKGFMALIWALFERNDLSADVLGHPLFSDDELAAIRTYLLPTYYENTVFAGEGIPYVAKSYWGREGKGTTLYGADGEAEGEEWGRPEDKDADEIKRYYGSQPRIYQQRIAMEETDVHTEDGPYRGCLLTGAYVIGGRFAGLLPRVGGKITGDLAYFCPAAVTE
ncbi:glutathionylspermidine synthase family protein [Paenibacillus arenilitoris]|uniref:Glutathionylspermidine synthase family protein n=1 Tax=Paenibacillus arenilitoris TaxID=2772299 RepID=A0A927H4I3_9BACL|nr:glutathionylspermidine synthase family protein [Paenibacillus arenilitoris]MBD2867513.1 glutathionylspermidine synthase family protein [Paenibacillus arenilitoris]